MKTLRRPLWVLPLAVALAMTGCPDDDEGGGGNPSDTGSLDGGGDTAVGDSAGDDSGTGDAAVDVGQEDGADLDGGGDTDDAHPADTEAGDGEISDGEISDGDSEADAALPSLEVSVENLADDTFPIEVAFLSGDLALIRSYPTLWVTTRAPGGLESLTDSFSDYQVTGDRQYVYFVDTVAPADDADSRLTVYDVADRETRQLGSSNSAAGPVGVPAESNQALFLSRSTPTAPGSLQLYDPEAGTNSLVRDEVLAFSAPVGSPAFHLVSWGDGSPPGLYEVLASAPTSPELVTDSHFGEDPRCVLYLPTRQSTVYVEDDGTEQPDVYEYLDSETEPRLLYPDSSNYLQSGYGLPCMQASDDDAYMLFTYVVDALPTPYNYMRLVWVDVGEGRFNELGVIEDHPDNLVFGDDFVVFRALGGDLSLYRAADDEPTTVNSFPRDLTLSPDQRYLAYLDSEDDTIHLLNTATGGDVSVVTAEPASYDLSMAWSADSAYLAVLVSEVGASDATLYLADTSGDEAVVLSDATASAGIRWVGTGDELLYVEDFSNLNLTGDLSLYRPSTDQTTPVVDDMAAVGLGAVSPDGTLVTVTVWNAEDHAVSLELVDVATGEQEQLREVSGEDEQLWPAKWQHWNANSDWLLFSGSNLIDFDTRGMWSATIER